MTLQANFLPVGSVVEYNGKPRVITANDIHNCQADNNWFNNHYRPIPLTPEILTEWCGFEPAVDSFGGLLSPEFNRGRIRIHDNKWYNGIEYIQLDYLHELQLLFLGMKQVLPITIK